jgi:hypothetical protein
MEAGRPGSQAVVSTYLFRPFEMTRLPLDGPSLATCFEGGAQPIARLASGQGPHFARQSADCLQHAAILRENFELGGFVISNRMAADLPSVVVFFRCGCRNGWGRGVGGTGPWIIRGRLLFV